MASFGQNVVLGLCSLLQNDVVLQQFWPKRRRFVFNLKNKIKTKRRRFISSRDKTTSFHGDACPKRTSPVRRSSWSSDRGNGQRGWGGWGGDGGGMGGRKAGPPAGGLSVGLKISHEPGDGGGGR